MSKSLRDHPRPWHRGSVYGPGRRCRFDRNRGARYQYLLWQHRECRRISANCLVVGLMLLTAFYCYADGRCDPSHAAIADKAGVSLSTAERSLKVLRALGLIDWERRLVRHGWRAEQTTNAYTLYPNAPAFPATVKLTVKPDKILSGPSTSVVRDEPDRVQPGRLLMNKGGLAAALASLGAAIAAKET